MAPRHVRVLHALQDAYRPFERNRPIQDRPLPPILDQSPRDRVRRAILRRPQREALVQNLRLLLRRKLRPHQLFGKVRRRRNQHQSLHALRPRHRRQQRHPAAHAGADQHQRALRLRINGRQRVGAPGADRAVLEGAARLPVSGIIEQQRAVPGLPRPGLHRPRLAAAHVGLEAAQPHERHPACRCSGAAERDPASLGGSERFRCHVGCLPPSLSPVKRVGRAAYWASYQN